MVPEPPPRPARRWRWAPARGRAGPGAQLPFLRRVAAARGAGGAWPPPARSIPPAPAPRSFRTQQIAHPPHSLTPPPPAADTQPGSGMDPARGSQGRFIQRNTVLEPSLQAVPGCHGRYTPSHGHWTPGAPLRPFFLPVRPESRSWHRTGCRSQGPGPECGLPVPKPGGQGPLLSAHASPRAAPAPHCRLSGPQPLASKRLWAPTPTALSVWGCRPVTAGHS